MTVASVLAFSLFADPCREGSSALQRRDLVAAESLLKQCTSVEGYVLLAGLYQLKQDPDALYKTAREGIQRFPSEKRFYLTVGAHEARNKQYDAAAKVLEEAVRRWPEDAKIRSLLASSHFAIGVQLIDNGKEQAAVDSLRRATELAPDDVEALLNLGRALHNLLRYSEARETFDRIIALNPSFPLARFHRGMALYALGEFDSAIADLTKEIETNSNYPPARLVRGMAFMAGGDWENAHKDLNIAAERMPDNASAHYGRARVLVKLGRLEEAETALRSVMDIDPTDPAPVNTLVSVLLRLDRQEEARVLVKKAAALAQNRRAAGPGEIRFESGIRK